jgi:hypothetical protein
MIISISIKYFWWQDFSSIATIVISYSNVLSKASYDTETTLGNNNKEQSSCQQSSELVSAII